MVAAPITGNGLWPTLALGPLSAPDIEMTLLVDAPP